MIEFVKICAVLISDLDFKQKEKIYNIAHELFFGNSTTSSMEEKKKAFDDIKAIMKRVKTLGASRVEPEDVNDRLNRMK